MFPRSCSSNLLPPRKDFQPVLALTKILDSPVIVLRFSAARNLEKYRKLISLSPAVLFSAPRFAMLIFPTLRKGILIEKFRSDFPAPFVFSRFFVDPSEATMG
jgi:hypothetical protein